MIIHCNMLHGVKSQNRSPEGVSNAVIGSFTYILLSNGLQLAGVPYNFVSLVNGVVFLIVVYVSFPKSKDKLLP